MNHVNNCILKIKKAKDFLENHRGEITSIILSFAIISIWLNTRFALFLFIVLAVHEGGHVWAMMKKSIGIRRVYFFIIGGGVVPERQFKSHDETAFVAIMGSVFTMILIALALVSWYILKIKLLADIVIFLSTITIFNLLPYAFLDGGLIRDSIQESHRFGQSLFLVPEVMIVSFLVFKSKMVLIILILLLVDSWRNHKRSELKKEIQNQYIKPKTIVYLTKKEIRSYYAAYFGIISICIILNLILELNGFKLDISSNFDDIVKMI